MMKNQLLPEVQAFVEGLELSIIPKERQEILQKLSTYIQDKLEKKEEVHLNFICTHNSRRSQLCQVWAYTAAFYHGLDQFTAFSGGTEATAFHPNAVRALKNAGFRISKYEKERNPVYSIACSVEADPLACFSKLYHDPANVAPFAAVMTCSEADINCPFIPEAETRFSITYEDPKIADGTPQEEQIYAERNRQIASEMFYLFSQIKLSNDK
ncbi:MAG: protein-tyrosine-phosphatase [Anditalea sp.]